MSGYGARRIRRRSRAGLLRITPGPARRRLEANSPAVQGMTIAYYARAGAPPPRGEFAGGPGHELLRITPGPARRRLEANSPAVQGMTIAYYARAGAPPPRGEFAGGPGHDYCVLRPGRRAAASRRIRRRSRA